MSTEIKSVRLVNNLCDAAAYIKACPNMSEQDATIILMKYPELHTHFNTLTDVMQMIAVNADPSIIVELEHPCNEAWCSAILQDPNILCQFTVPETAVFEYCRHGVVAFKHIPTKYMTEDFCYRVLTQLSLSFGAFIPNSCLTNFLLKTILKRLDPDESPYYDAAARVLTELRLSNQQQCYCMETFPHVWRYISKLTEDAARIALHAGYLSANEYIKNHTKEDLEMVSYLRLQQ